MAAKRLLKESEHDSDQLETKRMRTRPSFAAVIREAVMVKSLQNFCAALEPMLRKVVNEEVERKLRCSARIANRHPAVPLQIQAEEASTLRLMFSKKLSLPVFTGSKIEDEDNKPLQILLTDDNGVAITLPCPIKVEILVLDGEFSLDQHDWTTTSEEFDRKIVRERTGKRPLLAGDVLVTVRDGIGVIGDLSFTDNSSWIRGRKFRLGARLAAGANTIHPRIREAKTEPFVVKDHRGELYKKHHPPSLDDEVWRLEKIGKDGAFHKKLAAHGIKKVQDFLKMWVVDPAGLRKVLGMGMSDKMWEVTMKHAKTCVLGTKHYVLRRPPRYVLLLNPICQVVRVMHNGLTRPTSDLTDVQRALVENMVRDAYMHWNSLEEVDGLLSETTLLLQEAQPPNHHQDMIRSNQYDRLLTDGFIDITPLPYGNWPVYLGAPIVNRNVYIMEDASSDGDSTPQRNFYNGS